MLYNLHSKTESRMFEVRTRLGFFHMSKVPYLANDG